MTSLSLNLCQPTLTEDMKMKQNLCFVCSQWIQKVIVWKCVPQFKQTSLTWLTVSFVTLHKLLSQGESPFYVHVTSRAFWHLTLRKISPSQDSYFGHMVNWQIMWRLIWWLYWSQLLVRGCQFTFTYTTKSFVFLPSQITEKRTSRLENINCSQISKILL